MKDADFFWQAEPRLFYPASPDGTGHHLFVLGFSSWREEATQKRQDQTGEEKPGADLTCKDGARRRKGNHPRGLITFIVSLFERPRLNMSEAAYP